MVSHGADHIWSSREARAGWVKTGSLGSPAVAPSAAKHAESYVSFCASQSGKKKQAIGPCLAQVHAAGQPQSPGPSCSLVLRPDKVLADAALCSWQTLLIDHSTLSVQMQPQIPSQRVSQYSLHPLRVGDRGDTCSPISPDFQI